jgi:hypothetical protein
MGHRRSVCIGGIFRRQNRERTLPTLIPARSTGKRPQGFGNREKGPSSILATYTYVLAGYRLYSGELSLSSRELSLCGGLKSLERWRGIL